MDLQKNKRRNRDRRHAKVRKVVAGTAQRPRLSVFRSGKHIYAQLIDDITGRTLVAASSRNLGKKDKKVNLAAEVGKLVARKALEKHLKRVVFDRGGFAYHGRVRALADGAREGGLEF